MSMLINIMDEELVEFQYQNQAAVLELSNKHIHLYYPELEQAFVCKVTDLSDISQMNESFPDRTSILLASQLHTKGKTNKDRFRSTINALLKQNKITATQHFVLQEFILTATCPPMKILEKLVIKGFTDILTMDDFAEDAPELTLAADILEAYIKELQNGIHK